MFEFPFFTGQESIHSDDQRVQHVTERLGQLSNLADHLVHLKSQVRWTVTGLAFDPPWELSKPVDLRRALNDLGIHEDFRQQASRSLLDILTAKVEIMQNQLERMYGQTNPSGT